MVQITDRAMDQLEAIRDEADIPTGQGVTLVANESGELGFGVTAPQPEDEVVERDGKTVIIVPQLLSMPLQQVVIDYVETDEMQGFTLEQSQ